MKLNFRQGLVSYQQSGPQPVFLLASTTPGFVDLSVAPKPTIATIAHGTSDYLLKFDQSITDAWGPLAQGVDNWLYWDVNVITGAITQGITQLEPIISTVEPATPVVDQMWFDQSASVFKVRNSDNTKWIVAPRVVVARVISGNTSQIESYPIGSGVGLNVPSSPGFILLDSQLRPLRTSQGELLTSDTPVRVKSTVGTSGVLTNPINDFIPVRASEPIPAMRLVYFNGEDTVGLASSNPGLLSPRTPVGIIEAGLALNEVGVVTQFGEITYDQWDWSSNDFGKPLYCGINGELQTTRPAGAIIFRVAYIKNAKTIVFGVDAEAQVQAGSTNSQIINGVAPIEVDSTTNINEETVSTISIASATTTSDGAMTAAQVLKLQELEDRLVVAEDDITNKADLGHTHSISEVIDLQATLDDKAPINHGHVISDVAELQNELNFRAYVNHNHTAAQITDFTSAVEDRVIDLLVAGSNITLTHNDVLNTLTISAAGGGTSSQSLLSSTLVLAPQPSAAIGIVGHFTQASMVHWAEYLAAFPLVVATAEVAWDQVDVADNTTFPNSTTVSFGVENRSAKGATAIDTSTIQTRVIEFSIEMPMVFSTPHSVGLFSQAYGPAFSPAVDRGGPLNTMYDSNGLLYNTSGTSVAPTWTTGDVIGVVFGDGSGNATFFKNGVVVGSVPLITGAAGVRALASRIEFIS
jgi:hypothetical protein